MSALGTLGRIARGDWGFRMVEDMSGWHEYLPGEGPSGRHPFRFRVAWGVDRVRDGVATDGGVHFVVPLSGHVTAGGLCDRAPCEGTLDLRYLVDGRLVYDFTFEAEGTAWRWVGQKVNVRPWNLAVSHTTCFGTLTDARTGRLKSRGVVHFRLGTIPAFLASWRPVMA